MSTAITTFGDPSRLPPLPLHRFTVEEYHRMIASSVLSENQRVDRKYKGLLYGRAGIVTYWIVNIPDSRIEVHMHPFEAGYRTVHNYGVGEVVPVVLDGRETGTIAVASLFAE